MRRGRGRAPRTKKKIRWAKVPRVPLAQPEPPSGGAQGCHAEARTLAIFSTKCKAEQWVRGSGKGTCFSFFLYWPLGTVSTPVTRQIRRRGQRAESREGLEGWEAMRGDRGELGEAAPWCKLIDMERRKDRRTEPG